jgi:hypothetical protein
MVLSSMSGMPGFVQNPEEFKSFCIPNFDGFVHASCRQQWFLGMDFQVVDAEQVCRNFVYRFPKCRCFFFPEHQSGIFSAGKEPGGSWKKAQSKHGFPMHLR